MDDRPGRSFGTNRSGLFELSLVGGFAAVITGTFLVLVFTSITW